MIKKTNAMRLLDSAKIKYETLEYEVDENDLSGMHISASIGLPPEIVFKTLVAKGDKNGYAVFCIPTDRELDLKAAAEITGDKKIEMIHVKDLLSLTGYIRGGCSPVGMKKKFPTFIDESASNFDKITVSAGVRGAVVFLKPSELIAYTNAKTAKITLDK